MPRLDAVALAGAVLAGCDAGSPTSPTTPTSDSLQPCTVNLVDTLLTYGMGDHRVGPRSATSPLMV